MKERIISAMVMLVIVIPIVYFGGTVFKVSVGILGVLGLREILNLKVSHKEIPVIVQLVSYITLLLLIYSDFDGYSLMFGISYRGLAIMMLSILGLSLCYKKEEYTITDGMFLVGAITLLGTSFNTMILTRMFGLWKFVYLILIFILTDTFAYLCGKAFGHHKLIPHVSPNKTIEGTVCGSLFGTLGASIFYHFLIHPINTKIILATIILSIIGQIGDLIFSKIKRENKIKDFSNLIPGHGGILDRLDSTIAIMLGYLIISNLIHLI